MANLLDFEYKVDYSKQVIPVYTLGDPCPTFFQSGVQFSSANITFSDGTTILKYFNLYSYNGNNYASLDVMLEHLPNDVIETILFNIDIFRSL